MSNQEKSDILSLMLDMAKMRTSIWWSCKRLLECDKTLRSGIDFCMECNMELNVPVVSIEDFDEKSKYLNNCRIRADIYDGDGYYLKTEYYTDLDVWCGLFSTTERIGYLEK